MILKPRIFVSAVSKELAAARQLVANTLHALGYEPVWQDTFDTDEGELRRVLERKIDGCGGLIQLVGRCYGAEPQKREPHTRRVSYTQFEADYARRRGKKVWYLLIDEAFHRDPPPAEPPELLDLQERYRRDITGSDDLYHPLQSEDQLKAAVLELDDKLLQLRRGVTRWAIGATALLVLCLAGVGWLAVRQTDERRAHDATHAGIDDLRQTGRETRRETQELGRTVSLEAAAAQVDRAVGAMDLGDYGQVEALEALVAAGRKYPKLRGVSLAAVELPSRNLGGTDFLGADLSQARFDEADLSKADLTLAVAASARFDEAKLGAAYGPFLSAEQASFRGADCRRASFFAGRLQRADFSGADLTAADLTMCDLREANFQNANLTDCFLSGSVLDGADFTGATFENTDLTGAILDKKRLTAEQFPGVVRTAGASDSGWIEMQILLIDKIPNRRFADGYQFSRMFDERWWLGGFGETSLPLGRPRAVPPVRKPVSGDAGGEYFTDFFGIHFEHEFLTAGERRGRVVARVREQMDLLKRLRSPDRVFGYGGDARLQELQKNAARAQLTGAPYDSADHLAVLLLAAGASDKEKVDWETLASQRFQLEKAVRTPSDDRREPTRDGWSPLYPPDYLRDETPRQAELYRAWTEKRMQVVPRDRLTVLRRLPDAEADAGAWRTTLEQVLSNARYAQDDLKRVLQEANVHVNQAHRVPSVPGLNLSDVALVFDDPLEDYRLEVENVRPADRTGATVELDLAVGKVEAVTRDGETFAMIRAVPTTFRIVTGDTTAASGSVQIPERRVRFTVLHTFSAPFRPERFLAASKDGTVRGLALDDATRDEGVLFSVDSNGKYEQRPFQAHGYVLTRDSRFRTGDDGALFGTCEKAGQNLVQGNVLFRVGNRREKKTDGRNPDAEVAGAPEFSILKEFERNDQPVVLLVASDYVYGGMMAPVPGGGGLQGALFRVRTDGSDFSILRRASVSWLHDGRDGWLYGVESASVFRLRPDGAEYQRLHLFAGNLEGEGCRSLRPAPDGGWLGLAEGGRFGKGVLFSLARDGGEYAVLRHLKNSGTAFPSWYVLSPTSRLLRLGNAEKSFQGLAIKELPEDGQETDVFAFPRYEQAGNTYLHLGDDGRLYGTANNDVFRLELDR